MNRFKVQIQGENFLVNCDGEHKKFGFRAQRIIDANDMDSARKIAIIRVHQELNESDFRIIENAESSRVRILDIIGLNKLQRVRKKSFAGFEFYPEEDYSELIDPDAND